MTDIMNLGASSTAKGTSQTAARKSGLQSGVRVPTVTSSGKVHLALDVDARPACRSSAIWPVRRILWRAPSELTCPVCWHVLHRRLA